MTTAITVSRQNENWFVRAHYLVLRKSSSRSRSRPRISVKDSSNIQYKDFSPGNQPRPEATRNIRHDILSSQHFASGICRHMHCLSHFLTDPGCHGLVCVLLTVGE